MSAGNAFDEYSLTARLFPALIVLTSPMATAAALWPSLLGGTWAAASAAASVALLFLAAQFVRDAGRRVEERLVRKWGGLPTRIALQSGNPSGKWDKARLRALVERTTGRTLPSAEYETRDPADSERQYAEAIAVLRNRTRDRNSFPTVLSANVTYGFRRNLLGAKPAGLFINAVCAAVLAGAMTNDSGFFGDSSIPAAWVAMLASVALLAVWAFAIKEDWVRAAADDYAWQLFDAATVLTPAT